MAKRTNPYIPGEQVNKKNIIKLNTNENPYAPSPKVLNAIQQAINSDLRLYPSPTVDEIKIAIAKHYNVRKENVFVGNGSDEVLAFSFMAFFEPNQQICFPEITYSFYSVYAKAFNIPYKKVPLQEDFSLQVESYFRSNGGVIFPNPNAPTSLYLALEQVEAILKNNRNKVVIVDEAYIDFASQSAISLVDKYENLLVIQTMSKSRSLAGLRIGFAIGNEALIRGLIRMKDSFNSYPIDRLAIAGAIAAIEDEAYFRKITKKIIATRTWTTDTLKQIGFHVLPSSTNFLFVAHPEVPAAFIYEQLRKKDILVRYFATEKIDNYLRITIGTEEEMIFFIDKLKNIIENYK